MRRDDVGDVAVDCQLGRGPDCRSPNPVQMDDAGFSEQGLIGKDLIILELN